jgi:hypothetical protein
MILCASLPATVGDATLIDMGSLETIGGQASCQSGDSSFVWAFVEGSGSQ